MYNPVSTYRIQLHRDFRLSDLERIIPYLQQLGIKTLYASPVFASVPGSTHGYDGIDPEQIDPEIGTEEDLRRVSARLKEAGIGWLQDIVPNHMAFHPGNAWLMDVLEKGRASAYAGFFDIGWERGEKLMVPFLGAPLAEVIDKGELKVTEHEGRWMFDYSGSRYPLAAASVSACIKPGVSEDPAARINEDRAQLRRLAEMQHYRLCHWQETDVSINYRRFFTVNGLICLNIQDPEVFGRVHAQAARLLQDGVISGLRIDHIDGLYDPAGYLEELRMLAGPDCYITVEKILEPGESLPARWPVQGTTGYDFLSLVNNLFTCRERKAAFSEYYDSLLEDPAPMRQQLHDSKAHILYKHMQGELDNLTRLFLDSGLMPEDAAVGEEILKEAIAEFLILCPVYRYYGNSLPLEAEEAAAVADILKRIRRSKWLLAPGAGVLEEALLRKPAEGDPDHNSRALHFYQRCMQFSGPLMAKGVEDTLMYTYNRFIGHNEVGDSPESFGISKEEFHKAMLERQAQWPLTINTTSTHDTKRGEDARAMLHVLTDLPGDWLKAASNWRALNEELRTAGAPDAADEYFIYQTLMATYPFDDGVQEGYGARLQEYLQKALREGKRRSDWAQPDEAYEEAATRFALGLLDQTRPFWRRFRGFRQSLNDFAMVQALAQLTLKFTCPGVPDVYQGTELWDLSLVDPDNRRPVDYGARLQQLTGIESGAAGPDVQRRLWETRSNGGIKLWLLRQLLAIRAADEELFRDGQYLPLRTAGRYKDHVFAFARRYGRRWILVAVPLHTAMLGRSPLDIDWKDTSIELPPHAPVGWKHLLGEAEGHAKGRIPVQEVFRTLPIGLVRLEQAVNERGAGILMPVTALPSRYGIGDLGPEARLFARSLSRAGQRYWQLLPLNPVSAGSGFSPYSSISAMAGNPMLISPYLLAKAGLLTLDELHGAHLPASGRVDYETVEQRKAALLDAAYARYISGSFPELKREVDSFIEAEASWLDDFALYVVLKRQQGDKPWYEWPEELRLRRSEALSSFAEAHRDELDKVRWQQAVFIRQWSELRAHGAMLGLQLIGDLPFYASYDSADVWTHPELFSVDEGGRMTGVAGVPPDYFSETGQLWGMPTYRWDRHKADGYAWWIERLRKNLQLYDVLRIDHFRALAAYWEVPAGEETAVNGQWIPGPDTHFFDAVRASFGGLPFIAEDLGDNMADVYRLRDEVGLPGMKVVQFAFGDNLPSSVDVPHNYGPNFVVYSGTHDNNTTLGWFRKELSKDDLRRLERYAGCAVTEKNAVDVIARLAYGSIARIAILPMQDVLRLDERARMNKPSSGSGNWRWRMRPGQFGNEHIAWLLEEARFYNRI